MKLLKSLIAVAVVLASVAAALAFTPYDSTKTPVKRFFSTQQTHYYRLTINYNDPQIGTNQQFGAVAQNAFIDRVMCFVVVAFNAGSTNVLTLGTLPATANELTGATGVTPGTIGFYDITAANTRGVAQTSDADHILYAKYAQTGTPATAGQAICVVEFTPNNDN
jgi:hypothetical protein